VIIDIDTPGGYVDSALKMRDAIISSEVRTIAYVDSRACLQALSSRLPVMILP